MSNPTLINFDYALHYLLQTKGDYSIVQAFISALLKTQGYQDVKIIALLETENGKQDVMSKRSFADLLVEDADQHAYIVEIERYLISPLIDEEPYNTSKLIVKSVKKEIDYTKILRVFRLDLEKLDA